MGGAFVAPLEPELVLLRFPLDAPPSKRSLLLPASLQRLRPVPSRPHRAPQELSPRKMTVDIEKAPTPLDGRREDKPTTTLNEDVAAYGLEKVLARHGRVDLVPMVRRSLPRPLPPPLVLLFLHLQLQQRLLHERPHRTDALSPARSRATTRTVRHAARSPARARSDPSRPSLSLPRAQTPTTGRLGANTSCSFK